MFFHCERPIHLHCGSTFTFLDCSKGSALRSLNFIPVFQMTAWGYFDLPTTSTSNKKKYVSIYLNDDNLKPKGKIGITSGHGVLTKCSDSFWWNSNVIDPGMKCTILVTRNIPCQCTVDGICALRVRTLKSIYVKKIGQAHALGKCLHRQRRDKIREAPRWTCRVAEYVFRIQILLYNSRHKCHWFQ